MADGTTELGKLAPQEEVEPSPHVVETECPEREKGDPYRKNLRPGYSLRRENTFDPECRICDLCGSYRDPNHQNVCKCSFMEIFETDIAKENERPTHRYTAPRSASWTSSQPDRYEDRIPWQSTGNQPDLPAMPRHTAAIFTYYEGRQDFRLRMSVGRVTIDIFPPVGDWLRFLLVLEILAYSMVENPLGIELPLPDILYCIFIVRLNMMSDSYVMTNAKYVHPGLNYMRVLHENPVRQARDNPHFFQAFILEPLFQLAHVLYPSFHMVVRPMPGASLSDMRLPPPWGGPSHLSDQTQAYLGFGGRKYNILPGLRELRMDMTIFNIPTKTSRFRPPSIWGPRIVRTETHRAKELRFAHGDLIQHFRRLHVRGSMLERMPMHGLSVENAAYQVMGDIDEDTLDSLLNTHNIDGSDHRLVKLRRWLLYNAVIQNHEI